MATIENPNNNERAIEHGKQIKNFFRLLAS